MMFAAFGLAASARVVMEDGLSAVPSSSWLQQSRCTGSTLSLMVMLKKSAAQKAKLEETFWAVSDPFGPKYGDFLTHSNLTALVGSSDAAIEEVVAWLTESGATYTAVAKTKDAIEVALPCSAAEKASYPHVFESP